MKATWRRKRVEADKATREGDLAKASRILYGEIPAIQKQLTEAEHEAEKEADFAQEDEPMVPDHVDADSVAGIVSEWTGIPVGRLMQGENENLLNMEEYLNRRVIGQPEAVRAVSDAVRRSRAGLSDPNRRRSRAGLSDPNRPTGSFLFMGPTGVGKTELAKALAEFLFDDEKAMIRLDRTEYMEKSSVSRLIVSAPWNVRYEEGGQLTEAVRRSPSSVVLFVEVEKANSQVFDILLQVLDDGRLTDGLGRPVDCMNPILSMTATLGSQFLVNPDLDEQQKKDAVMNAVHSQFRPEVLTRLDDLEIFPPLTRQELGKIVDLQVKQVASRLTDRRITLDVTEAAREGLADTGYDPAYGLFDDEKAMIRIDMSEYMEKSSVSRLIGAAPGYVGYEEGGQLTEAVRRRPYSVVLFDEVEKANSEVFDILLQVLDDGRLTDGQGRTVDFKNTILIMTSNLGSQFLVNPDLDEQQKKDAVMNAVHSQFRPEFLNRLDDMVIFHPLTRQELGKIVDLQVKQVASRLTDRRITLDVTEAAREWLADTGYDPAYGARPLRRLVQTEVGDQLARMLLAGEIKDGDTVLVDHTGGEHLELTDHTHNPMEGDPNPGDSQITVDDKKDDGEQKDA